MRVFLFWGNSATALGCVNYQRSKISGSKYGVIMSNHACFWPCLLLYFFGLCPLQVERTLIYIYTVYYTTARASLCVCECGSVCVLVIFSKILPQINVQLRVLGRSLSLSTFFYTSLYEQKRFQRWLHRMGVTACQPVSLQGVRCLDSRIAEWTLRLYILTCWQPSSWKATKALQCLLIYNIW